MGVTPSPGLSAAVMRPFTLLGGAAQDDVVLYRAISQEAPERMSKKIELLSLIHI